MRAEPWLNLVLSARFTYDSCPKEKPTPIKTYQDLYSHVTHSYKANWDEYVKQHGGRDKLKTAMPTVGEGTKTVIEDGHVSPNRRFPKTSHGSRLTLHWDPVKRQARVL